MPNQYTKGTPRTKKKPARKRVSLLPGAPNGPRPPSAYGAAVRADEAHALAREAQAAIQGMLRRAENAEQRLGVLDNYVGTHAHEIAALKQHADGVEARLLTQDELRSKQAGILDVHAHTLKAVDRTLADHHARLQQQERPLWRKLLSALRKKSAPACLLVACVMVAGCGNEMQASISAAQTASDVNTEAWGSNEDGIYIARHAATLRFIRQLETRVAALEAKQK